MIKMLYPITYVQLLPFGVFTRRKNLRLKQHFPKPLQNQTNSGVCVLRVSNLPMSCKLTHEKVQSIGHEEKHPKSMIERKTTIRNHFKDITRINHGFFSVILQEGTAKFANVDSPRILRKPSVQNLLAWRSSDKNPLTRRDSVSTIYKISRLEFYNS